MESITRDEVIGLVRDGRRYREKRGKWERFWIALVAQILFAAPLQGWMFMLAVGLVHHEWWRQVPTIGYWWAVILAALLTGLFGKYPVRGKS